MNTSTERDYEFPPELLEPPQALVGAIGLDIQSNSIHRAIWDAFRAERRPSESLVRLKHFKLDHEYPKPKPEKSSYEMHIPKGILKRTWMHKHLTQLPAVLSVFYDLEWDDPNWEEKKQDCVSRVFSLRHSLDGIAKSICIVLIQKLAPTPTAEDLEKAKQLFISAGLTNKLLFVLPYEDHLPNWTSKIKRALFDLAVPHYQAKIVRIQSHRENLNKKTHQYLYVRHCFKMGFYSEMNHDLSMARKYYREAYNYLLEVRLSDTNEFEVKTVAGFIGYKVSRIGFAQNKWDEAFSHFKAHIEHYKHIVGPKQLVFQHHAWLSKQYGIFADLFEETMHHEKKTTRSIHPGYYNKLAAKQAELRKQVAKQLCSEVHCYPSPDPLSGWENLEFYGQRPWRPCKLSAEPLDPELEQMGILALQYNEKSVDHSSIIISLLGSAISQFKAHRCQKMMQNLMNEMAEEYFLSKEYRKALILLMHTFWDYRVSKWDLIIEKLMRIALASAYLTASIAEYAELCVDIMSRNTPQSERSLQSLKNLIMLTNGQVPDPEPNLDPNEVLNAQELWTNAKSENLVSVNMSSYASPVQCKAAIVKNDFDCIQINIILRSSIPQSFVFSKLNVTVLGGSGEKVSHLVATRLEFNYTDLNTFTCSFVPNLQDIGKPMQIISVSLLIGEIEGRIVELKFNGLGRDSSILYKELLHFKQLKGTEGDFVKLESKLKCVVSRRLAKIKAEIKHNPPALLNEWYPLRLNILNEESSPVTSANLTIAFPQNFDQEIIHKSNFYEGGSSNFTPLPFSLDVDDLNQLASKCFYIRCSCLQTRQLEIRLTYIIDGHLCVVESQIEFKVEEPFKLSAKYMSTKFEELNELFTREPFLIQPEIKSLSPWPITIHSTSIIMSENFQLDGEFDCLLKGCELESDNTASELICASVKKFSSDASLVGTFVIEWARSGESVTSTFNYSLPEKAIVDIPISVIVDAPATAIVKKQYVAKYQITNHSSKLIILQVKVKPSTSFTFAGVDNTLLFLLPESTKEVEYQMYPLCCGTAALPVINLNVSKESNISNLDQIVQRALPANIFIMPDGKKCEDSQ